VEARGIEPRSARDPQSGATFLADALVGSADFHRPNSADPSSSSSRSRTLEKTNRNLGR